jgi:SAM-dependent methyltransferase
MYQLQICPDDIAAGEHVADEGNAFTAMAALVGEHKRVLNLGCSSDYFAQSLARRGNEISDVRLGDLDQGRLSELLADGSCFDVIVCGDALERLREPVRALEDARGFLADGGYLVASIPNVAHGAVRLALLTGSFDYQELGILDAEHLRFFTKKSVDELFLSAGFRIGHIERIKQPIFEESELIPRVEVGDFSNDVVLEVLADPESDTRQFVLQAFPLTDDERVRALSKSFFSASAELIAMRRRGERRERELVNARERSAHLERSLEEVRTHLGRAEEEMRRAQDSHAELERERLQIPDLRAPFEEARAEQERLRTEHDALAFERTHLVGRVEHLTIELERLRPFVDRAHRAEVASARLEGREALLDQHVVEMGVNAERAQCDLRALMAEHTLLRRERDGLQARLTQSLENLDALTVAMEERSRASDRAFADHIAYAIAEARAESSHLASLIETVQTGPFWKPKDFLQKLRALLGGRHRLQGIFARESSYAATDTFQNRQLVVAMRNFLAEHNVSSVCSAECSCAKM